MNKKSILLENVKNLPTSSGVYKMFDSLDEIIYVGKAKNLRNRVKSYFDNSPKNLKTRILVDNIVRFEYTITDSELDAFSLECNLIKENKPKYNILLKDDKAFPYIRIDKNQKYPEVTVVRKVKNDGALYFGPYVTGLRVYDILNLIRSAFQIRVCKHNFAKIKPLTRACLFGEIGSCSAPCINRINEKDYDQIINNVIDFLNGKNSYIKKVLIQKMNASAQSADFENAIKYRNLVESVKKSEEKLLTSLPNNSNFDAFAFVEKEGVEAVSVVIVKKGKVVAETSQIIDSINKDDGVLLSFIAQYYESNKVPGEIILNISNYETLQNYLMENFSKSIKLSEPKIGEKKKLLEMAKKNAEEFILKNKTITDRRQQMTIGALIELQDILGLSNPIDRIEGFDISNISGTNNVSSMVVFLGGVPAKKEYRKFKIKTFEGANDFRSMQETLSRRFLALKEGKQNFTSIPDLILIDGGLGQLHSAQTAMNNLGFDVPIISLAKREEEIFTTSSNTSIKLNQDSNARKLLQRIRDESHRFAVGYHRTLRGKGLKTELENISGVGRNRVKNILSRYKSSEDLMSASITELAEIPTISGKIAKNIFDYLHR